jgi:hypothetical protein
MCDQPNFSFTNGATYTMNDYMSNRLFDSCSTGIMTPTNTTTMNANFTLNNNSTSMNEQVKVAVFRVERNKHNGIKSSTFVDEYWIEKKPGVSIDYAVALELQSRGLGKTKAEEIVIKQIYTVTL